MFKHHYYRYVPSLLPHTFLRLLLHLHLFRPLPPPMIPLLRSCISANTHTLHRVTRTSRNDALVRSIQPVSIFMYLHTHAHAQLREQRKRKGDTLTPTDSCYISTARTYARARAIASTLIRSPTGRAHIGALRANCSIRRESSVDATRWLVVDTRDRTVYACTRLRSSNLERHPRTHGQPPAVRRHGLASLPGA